MAKARVIHCISKLNRYLTPYCVYHPRHRPTPINANTDTAIAAAYSAHWMRRVYLLATSLLSDCRSYCADGPWVKCSSSLRRGVFIYSQGEWWSFGTRFCSFPNVLCVRCRWYRCGKIVKEKLIAWKNRLCSVPFPPQKIKRKKGKYREMEKKEKKKGNKHNV